jgi:hypothetical protein
MEKWRTESSIFCSPAIDFINLFCLKKISDTFFNSCKIESRNMGQKNLTIWCKILVFNSSKSHKTKINKLVIALSKFVHKFRSKRFHKIDSNCSLTKEWVVSSDSTHICRSQLCTFTDTALVLWEARLFCYA